MTKFTYVMTHQFSDGYFGMTQEEINIWQWQKVSAPQLSGLIQCMIWCYNFLKNSVSKNNTTYSWQRALKNIVLSESSELYWLVTRCFFYWERLNKQLQCGCNVLSEVSCSLLLFFKVVFRSICICLSVNSTLFSGFWDKYQLWRGEKGDSWFLCGCCPGCSVYNVWFTCTKCRYKSFCTLFVRFLNTAR